MLKVHTGGSYLTTTGNMLGLAEWDFSMEEHDENQDFRAAHTVMAIIRKPPREKGRSCARARVQLTSQVNTQSRMPTKMQKGKLGPYVDDPLVKYWISRGANPSLKLNSRGANP